MSYYPVLVPAPPVGRRSPPSPGGGPTTPRPGFAVTVGRALGVVVVTVHGILDAAGCARLEQVLEDLIENQGNLAVVVDLRFLIRVDPDGLAVFRGAETSAATLGAKFILADPCDTVHRALGATGLAPAITTTGRFNPLPGRRVSSAREPMTESGRAVASHPAGKGRYRSE